MVRPSGGLGGRSRGIRDTRLAERALREQWPVPKTLRGPLIKRLGKIALDADASPREAVAAARAILAASRINLDSIAATIKADEHEELAERVADLEQRVNQDRGAPLVRLKSRLDRIEARLPQPPRPGMVLMPPRIILPGSEPVWTWVDPSRPRLTIARRDERRSARKPEG